MAWERLPVDYTDAVWSGLKRYSMISNEDGTVSFQDVTVYSNKENSFFGARDANRMNEALNTIMSMLENGTDVGGELQNQIVLNSDRIALLEYMVQNNDYVAPIAMSDDITSVLVDDFGNVILANWKYEEV